MILNNQKDYMMKKVNLKQLRLDHDLSQADLAQLGNVQQARVSRFENDRENIPESFLDELSLHLDISPYVEQEKKDDDLPPGHIKLNKLYSGEQKLYRYAGADLSAFDINPGDYLIIEELGSTVCIPGNICVFLLWSGQVIIRRFVRDDETHIFIQDNDFTFSIPRKDIQRRYHMAGIIRPL